MISFFNQGLIASKNHFFSLPGVHLHVHRACKVVSCSWIGEHLNFHHLSPLSLSLSLPSRLPSHVTGNLQ